MTGHRKVWNVCDIGIWPLVLTILCIRSLLQPKELLVSIIHHADEEEVIVNILSNPLNLCWCQWCTWKQILWFYLRSMLPQATLSQVIPAALEYHVNITTPKKLQKLWWCPSSMLTLVAMLNAIVCVASDMIVNVKEACGYQNLG